jgi:hypothetical protein
VVAAAQEVIYDLTPQTEQPAQHWGIPALPQPAHLVPTQLLLPVVPVAVATRQVRLLAAATVIFTNHQADQRAAAYWAAQRLRPTTEIRKRNSTGIKLQLRETLEQLTAALSWRFCLMYLETPAAVVMAQYQELQVTAAQGVTDLAVAVAAHRSIRLEPQETAVKAGMV